MRLAKHVARRPQRVSSASQQPRQPGNRAAEAQLSPETAELAMHRGAPPLCLSACAKAAPPPIQYVNAVEHREPCWHTSRQLRRASPRAIREAKQVVRRPLTAPSTSKQLRKPSLRRSGAGVAKSVSFRASAAPARACAALHSICRGRAALSSAPAPPATPPSHGGTYLVSSGERARACCDRASTLHDVH